MAGVFLCVGVGLFFATQHTRKIPVTACTQEAKICPDGSTVGRTGPDCQFARCPLVATSTNVVATHQKGYLIGYVTLSPTCPVEHTPPDPACAPEPYAPLIDISGSHNFFIELHANMEGVFQLPLVAGIYTILPHINSLYPNCPSKTVTLSAGATTTVDIMCDTGIR